VFDGVLSGADGRWPLRSSIVWSEGFSKDVLRAPELPPLGLPVPFVFHDEKAEDWPVIGVKVEMVEAGVN
jgi:hypothetical protein